jgi:hypothetical protein
VGAGAVVVVVVDVGTVDVVVVVVVDVVLVVEVDVVVGVDGPVVVVVAPMPTPTEVLHPAKMRASTQGSRTADSFLAPMELLMPVNLLLTGPLHSVDQQIART